MYGFLSTMWVMRKIDVDYLSAMVKKGFITVSEKDLILDTPQLEESSVVDE